MNRPFAVLLTLSGLLPAQDPAQADTASHKLSWPRDQQRVIGSVDGRDVTLDELIRHVDARHAPGYREFLGTDAGRFELEAPFAARWVRQYLDVSAMQAEARARGLDPAHCETALADALKNGFEVWLRQYEEQRRLQGATEPLQQATVDKLLARYQREFGLECEFQGWLDALVPDRFTDEELYDYYTGHARELGGFVDLAHILVLHRDPGTGELLPEPEQGKVRELVAEIRSRLAADGSNFAEVARLLSQDRRTAERGGTLTRVSRFDPRLPAELCRTAWSLKDGEVTGPVETIYGLHFVKRLRFTQHAFALYTEKFKPIVREHIRWRRQEDLLFEVRRTHGIERRY